MCSSIRNDFLKLLIIIHNTWWPWFVCGSSWIWRNIAMILVPAHGPSGSWIWRNFATKRQRPDWWAKGKDAHTCTSRITVTTSSWWLMILLVLHVSYLILYIYIDVLYSVVVVTRRIVVCVHWLVALEWHIIDILLLAAVCVVPTHPHNAAVQPLSILIIKKPNDSMVYINSSHWGSTYLQVILTPTDLRLAGLIYRYYIMYLSYSIQWQKKRSITTCTTRSLLRTTNY